MRIAVVHNSVDPNDAPDERDVLVQADSIFDSLIGMGHLVETFPCDLNLSVVRDRLAEMNAGLVFNLVEAIEGHGRLIHLFPFLLDAMALPYTGSSAESLILTSNKILAKDRMEIVSLPTAPWIGPYPESIPGIASTRSSFVNEAEIENWIVKSVWEHASIGLDKNCLIQNHDLHLIWQIMKERVTQLGGACFAERFIDGREFSLSMLSGPDGVEILPPAEILFNNFEPGKPRIVDYRAKWDEASYEYRHTPRSFLFGREDAILIRQLKELAFRCWKVFGLKGYARIDFRVDIHGQPWILEINANPCLSPDAGFAAAACEAGIAFDQMIHRIVKDALCRYQINTID